MSTTAKPRHLAMHVPAVKPRNPLVAAAARRLAGAHGRGNARQAAQRELHRELQRELHRLHPPSL